MRDARLVRQLHYGKAKKNSNYIGRHRVGIALIPLGNRGRVLDFGDEAIEERSNDKTRMYLR